MTGTAHDPAADHGAGEAASGREAAVFGRIEAFRRRRPRLRDEVVTLAHGAGGKASAASLHAVFLPAFARDEHGTGRPLTDAAILHLPSGERLAFSTDSYVVKPLRFPGGSAGHLAVHGTINDLAMMGARPVAISAAFVLEEGMPIDVLRQVVADMAEAAAAAGVPVVTGDTKVVDRGAADGMYITTAGVGPSRPAVSWRRPRWRWATSCSSRGPWATTGRRSCWPGATWPWRRTSPRTPPRSTRWWRTSSRPHRPPGGCATRPGAAWAPSATSWPATRT